MSTRGEILKYSLMFWLGRFKIQGRKGVLTEDDRRDIANSVVDAMIKSGDPLDLKREVPRQVGHARPLDSK